MFGLTSEQEMMRNSVRRLVERRIEPALAASDPNRPLPKSLFLDILGALAELGLTAARVPAEAGGPGLSMVEYGLMLEQLPAPVAVSLIAHEAAVARLHAETDEAQRRRFLPELIAGRQLGCTGATEPAAGSDPRGIEARLTQDGARLLLNGRKLWITNVSACDLIIVTCRDQRPGARRGAVTKVVVERAVSPFSAREIDTIGLRQGMLGEAVFEDCPVPADNMIESPRGGTEVLKASWAVNRPLFGLVGVALAQRAYDIAVEHAKLRRQFGKPIAAHQLVQKNLSDMMTAITASRLLCLNALDLVDRGQGSAGAAAMAKRFAQNACRDAVFQAINMLGSMGLATETRVERLYRDATMLATPDGTNEILALIHGRELTGLEAFRGTAT